MMYGAPPVTVYGASSDLEPPVERPRKVVRSRRSRDQSLQELFDNSNPFDYTHHPWHKPRDGTVVTWNKQAIENVHDAAFYNGLCPKEMRKLNEDTVKYYCETRHGIGKEVEVFVE